MRSWGDNLEGLNVDVVNKIETLVKAAHACGNDVIKVDGRDYWRNNQSLILDRPKLNNISVSSLSSIVSYIKDNREDIKPEGLILHVVSPDKVVLLTIADERKDRNVLMNAGLMNDMEQFPFERFMDTEEFIIGLMSRFEDMGEREDVKAIVSTLRSEESLQADDNGATTNYEAKHGVVSLSGVKIPDVVELYPFRTFRQVEQPGSIFIFRYRANDNGSISVGLFEADGGAWKHKAMSSIENYFKANLTGVQIIA